MTVPPTSHGYRSADLASQIYLIFVDKRQLLPLRGRETQGQIGTWESVPDRAAGTPENTSVVHLMTFLFLVTLKVNLHVSCKAVSSLLPLYKLEFLHGERSVQNGEERRA